MMREDLFREEVAEELKKLRIEGYNGDYFDEADLIDLIWTYYNIGYQDRIDDYDEEKNTTAQDEWERTR